MLLLPEELKAFFEKHRIPLQNTKAIHTNDEILSILFEAEKLNTGLSGFILYALVNPEKTKVETNFADYDDLYECYVQFSTALSSQNKDVV